MKTLQTVPPHRREAEARLTAEKEAERQAEARAAKILRRRNNKDSPHSTPSHTHYLSTAPPLRKEFTEEVNFVCATWDHRDAKIFLSIFSAWGLWHKYNYAT